jgi:ribosomal protein L11 methyltransferase
MQYIQVTFSFQAIQEFQQDLLIAELADIGFNTFEDAEKGFSAFIDAANFNELSLKEI